MASVFWDARGVIYIDYLQKGVTDQITSSCTLFARFISSDYFLFPNLKKCLGGQIFANNKEVETTVYDYFEELDGFHYKQGIKAIEHHWEKFIERKGDYIGK